MIITAIWQKKRSKKKQESQRADNFLVERTDGQWTKKSVGFASLHVQQIVQERNETKKEFILQQKYLRRVANWNKKEFV